MSCLFFSSLVSSIVINQLLIMIRKVFASRAWFPIAKSASKPQPLQYEYPSPLISSPASFNSAFLSHRLAFNFSDENNNKKPDDEKKRDQKEKEAAQTKQEKETEKEKEQKETWQQKIEKFVDNFWEKPDPNDPQKKVASKPEQLFKKFGNLIENCMIHLRTFYYRKFRVSSVLLVLLGFYLIFKYIGYEKELSPQVFMELLRMHSFEEVEFIEEEYFRNNDIPHKKITGKLNGERYYCEVLSFDEVLAYVAKQGNIKYKNIRRSSFESALNSVYQVMDTVFILFILGTIIRAPKGGMGGAPQIGAQPKKFDIIKNVNIKFNDVAGLHQSKREVQQVVDFLKNPEKYHALGATIPKGVLLTGPPGTGKTMLAKACAGEAGVPFFSVSGSDFVEVFVGVGASRVRQLFQQAKEQSPSIIFIDELDAVGKKRQNKMGSNDERESTLNQLLVEMDGFGTNAKVIVMAATNRKDILDNALVRPGRFDRQVQVGLPDLKGRFEILLVHLRPLVLSDKYTHEDYAKRIASLTPGFSGAELANLCNEAAILAARCGKQRVEMLDFELSSERVIGGVERKGFVSLHQKKTVAYHESGHAVVSWFLEGADPLLKVSIIPRSKGALGFAQYFLNENQLQTREELMDRICFILGGRCAELFFFNQITTGAYDDLEKAYNIAYHIVAKFGMDTALGYIAFPDPQYTKPYGQKVQSLIDIEIKKIIDECTERTKAIIRQHEKDIKNLAEELLVKETIDVRTIVRILGERPYPINKTFEAYLETEQTQ